MGNVYEIYALRYATMSPRTPHLNYLLPDPHETTAQDLDYFVWLIRGHGRDILVDTGFNAEEAKLRSRKLTLNPAPPYPVDAWRARIQGRVVLKVLVESSGLVSSVAVHASSGSASLDDSALTTVRTWRFEPARRRGSAVAHEVLVPVRFTIVPN